MYHVTTIFCEVKMLNILDKSHLLDISVGDLRASRKFGAFFVAALFFSVDPRGKSCFLLVHSRYDMPFSASFTAK
jgi:hypothetical protein